MWLKSKTHLFKGFIIRFRQKKLYYLVLNNIMDDAHVEQRFKIMSKFRFVELLNLKLFHAYKKNFQSKCFQLWMYIKMYWIWMEIKLKSVDAADFAKQASSIQEVAEVIWELKLNQALAEVTRLLCLILTRPVTFAFCERSSSSLKHVNDYMSCSQSEVRLNNLVYIFLNKDLLKKMKVEHGAVIFYN